MREVPQKIEFMKKLFLLIFALNVFCLQAQVSSMRLGYCDGEVATKGQIGVSGENVVEAAIYLPESTLKLHAGNLIESINAGLAVKLNITSLTVWVRSELNGENLAEGSAESIKKGWNDVMLSSPYEIEGDKGLYVGYTFSQKGSAYGISTVGEYQENAIFVKLGTESEWETPSDKGLLSLEAMVVGENLPKYDLELVSASFKENYPMDTQLPVTIEVKNVASYTITGFDVNFTVVGFEPIISHVDCNLEYDAKETFVLEIKPEIKEVKNGVNMNVALVNLKEGEDQSPENNELDILFNVINKEFKRNILIEEFTTEKCPNCPFGTNTLHGALEILEEEFPGQLNVVCHHAGFYTDWLTVGASEDLLWLYNSGGQTYAPAFMSDRMGVFSNPGTAEKMADIYRERLNTPSYVDVKVEGSYDSENNLLTVNVSGERSMDFCENPPHVVVYVVENEITARNQGGATGTYIHQHVLRAYNSAYGEEIVWNEDNTFEYSCELNIKAAWLTNNMEVVAFVSDYNSSDATSCVVENSAKIAFTDFYVDSIDSITSQNIDVKVNNGDIEIFGEYKSAEVYSINGERTRLNGLESGIYILKVVTNDGTLTRKLIVK